MLIDKDYIAQRFGVSADTDMSEAAPKKQKRKPAKGQRHNATGEEKTSKEFDDSAEAAFRQIERWILHRDRSVSETRSGLKRKGYSEASIEEAIERALACKYLDDLRFADILIRSKLNQGKGLSGIERSLNMAQIPLDSIPGYPEEYLQEAPSQLDMALSLLDRKPPRSKNLRQGAYGKLVRNGFSSGVASEAAALWVEKRELDT